MVKGPNLASVQYSALADQDLTGFLAHSIFAVEDILFLLNILGNVYTSKVINVLSDWLIIMLSQHIIFVDWLNKNVKS